MAHSGLLAEREGLQLDMLLYTGILDVLNFLDSSVIKLCPCFHERLPRFCFNFSEVKFLIV